MTNDTMKKLAVLLDTTEEKLNVVLNTLNLEIVDKGSSNSALEEMPEPETVNRIDLIVAYDKIKKQLKPSSHIHTLNAFIEKGIYLNIDNQIYLSEKETSRYIDTPVYLDIINYIKLATKYANSKKQLNELK